MPFADHKLEWLADSQAVRAASFCGPVKCRMCGCVFYSAADGRGGTVFTDRVELGDYEFEWHGFCHACLEKILKAIDQGELEANFVEAVRNFGKPKPAGWPQELRASTSPADLTSQQSRNFRKIVTNPGFVP